MNQPRYIAIDRRQNEEMKIRIITDIALFSVLLSTVTFMTSTSLFTYGTPLTTESKVSSEVTGAQQEPDQAPPTEELEPGLVAPSEDEAQGPDFTPEPTPQLTPLQEETPETPPPDDDCLFDPSLPKCQPIEGSCPEGFLMNEDEQCFPDKPCPHGYTKIDEDETGTCYPSDPTPEEDTDDDIDVIIVNEITNKIKEVKTTQTASCTPQSSTITLGPGSIAEKGVRVLASFDPCILTGGGAILNLPDSDNNLKLVAVDLEGGKMHKAVEIDLQKVQTMAGGQTLYTADFAQTITGLSPVTNEVDTIEDTNSLVLLNDLPRQMNFVDDNSVAFNAILSN